MNQLKRLLGNRRGSATIEFALASLFLFGTIMVALDFGFYAQQRLRLGDAVEQGAVMAYNTQPGATTTPISTYVAAAATTKTTTNVAITCNGTTTCGDGKCSCITAAGGFALAGSCSATCSGSSAISGNYLKIEATTTYQPVIVPNKWLGGKEIKATAVVRLQ